MPIHRNFKLGESMAHALGLYNQLPRFLASFVARNLSKEFFTNIETSDVEVVNCGQAGPRWVGKPSNVLSVIEGEGEEHSSFEVRVGGLITPQEKCLHVHRLKDNMVVGKNDSVSASFKGFRLSSSFEWKIKFKAGKPQSLNNVLCEVNKSCPLMDEEWLMGLTAQHEGKATIEIGGPGFRFNETKTHKGTDELKFIVTPHDISPVPRDATESGASGLEMPMSFASGLQLSSVTSKNNDCNVEIVVILADAATNASLNGGKIKVKNETRLKGPENGTTNGNKEGELTIANDGTVPLGGALIYTQVAEKACGDLYWSHIQLTVTLIDANGTVVETLVKAVGGEHECPDTNRRDKVVQLAGRNAQLYFKILVTSKCANP
ncbi:MAG: hypothetical protein AAFN77_24245 [Planctomycetota bacterium]